MKIRNFLVSALTIAAGLLACASTAYAGLLSGTVTIVHPLGGIYFTPISDQFQGTVAGQGSVSISGQGATAYSSGNSANGVLKASGFTSAFTFDDLTTYTRAIGSVRLSDTLTFSGTQAFDGVIRVTVLGDLFDPGRTGLFYASQADATFSLNTFSPGGFSLPQSRELHMWADTCSGQPNCIVGTHFRKILDVPFHIFSNYRDIGFDSALAADGMMGGTANFANSAYFELLDIPTGVTFTSTTGFLTAPVGIPGEPGNQVPEPPSLMLMAAALLALGISKYKVVARPGTVFRV